MSTVKVLFFAINGSGLGHLNRCLAYARRLDSNIDPCFFSLASACEIIEGMGFEAEYFVSHYWSANSTFSWNSELAVRFGMVLERVRPEVVVFDGTWPFQGFLAACASYGTAALVWSNRGLLKRDVAASPVDEGHFDLIIEPGEYHVIQKSSGCAPAEKRTVVPPVCLLDEDELLSRADSRKALGLSDAGRYALFSLGPGNLKDISGIGHGLIELFMKEGFQVIWTRAPISVDDVHLPPGVESITLYPLARCMRAFDVFIGAAGYNTCCEVVQAQIPSLLVPNAELADDQTRRAEIVSRLAPVVVSPCENVHERSAAVKRLLVKMQAGMSLKKTVAVNGAGVAADLISKLALERAGKK